MNKGKTTKLIIVALTIMTTISIFLIRASAEGKSPTSDISYVSSLGVDL